MMEKPSPHVLTVFATWHGQTRRIAEFVAEHICKRGYVVSVMSAEEAMHIPYIGSYDRIIVCAGVRFSRHHESAIKFIKHFKHALAMQSAILISVSGTAEEPDKNYDRLEELVLKLSRHTHWWPEHVVFAAGSYAYTQYNDLVRWMMARIAKANGGPTDTTVDHERTDWPRVERALDTIFPEQLEIELGAERAYDKVSRGLEAGSQERGR